MRRLPIRARLVLGTTAIAAAVLLVALLVARVEVARLLEDSAVELAQDDLAPFATDLRSNPGEAPDPPSNGQLIVIRDPSGRTVVDTAPHDVRYALPRTATAGSFDFGDDEGRSYVVVGERVRVSSGDWSVWAARDVSSARSAIAGIDGVFVATGLVLLGVMAGASFLVARGALRPVEELRRHAEDLHDAELLPVPPARDELSRLATTLNESVSRVRAAADRERRMASDAAHELRTPLAGLRAELELARRHRSEPAELDARLEAAERSASRLGDLAGNLLELSRLDEGGTIGSASGAELVAEALAAVDRARSLLAASRVTVDDDVSLPRPETRYAIDPIGLARIADNLLSNAAREAIGRIRISLSDADGLELRVADDGPGMPPEFVPHALERFTRPDASRSRSGAGLGLALVAAIAQGSGGEVVLESARTGLTVVVRIPACESSHPSVSPLVRTGPIS